MDRRAEKLLRKDTTETGEVVRISPSIMIMGGFVNAEKNHFGY